MKMMNKKVLASAVAASAIALSAVAPVANAEVSASVGAANMYYWRGLDLGNGDPAISGDITLSAGGFYGGVWGSSGDAGLGQEYDLYVGFGGEAGSFTYDVSLWNYNYPSATDDMGNDASPDIGDLTEAVVSLGLGPVAVTYYHGLEDLDEYWYATVGATFDKFSVTYGLHEDDLAHVDLGYAFNDNLSFTLGQVVDDVDGSYDDDTKFIVSLSLPIEF
ncbi:TorF family putative porin [Gilvimarinus sp. SDUM040013]|uniref:TorF family putative porin n=1 Tax=Gilvimarinus gilvus TaxID=3058038 RepID=A0ABU4S0B2_9GAMM|nr:TorF family putative porin [Gilvimarinus sp. SDUM040013]MDO3385295.1 TorF family putative porin [Gilvimarinus sp. SDUM040013]MDX6849278.1 TorF family putative porin [Gilvimarinus sp. SDUM040013]